MNHSLFGFIIDNDIQLDIANRRLVRIYSVETERSILFGVVSLNDTMVRLLVFLLQHGQDHDNKMTKDDILKNVWEVNDRAASSQRLWQAIKELRLKLSSIGLPSDFIINVRGAGYSLGNHTVTPLFY